MAFRLERHSPHERLALSDLDFISYMHIRSGGNPTLVLVVLVFGGATG